MDETYGIEIRRAESHEGTDCALCQPEFDGKTAKPSPCYAPTASRERVRRGSLTLMDGELSLLLAGWGLLFFAAKEGLPRLGI